MDEQDRIAAMDPDAQVDAAEATAWIGQAAQVKAWLCQWDAWCPDDGRPQAVWCAAREYQRTGTPEARERLCTAQLACQAATDVPVSAYWVRRQRMQGAQVAFHVARAVEHLAGMLLGTCTAAAVERDITLAARARDHDQCMAARAAAFSRRGAESRRRVCRDSCPPNAYDG